MDFVVAAVALAVAAVLFPALALAAAVVVDEDEAVAVVPFPAVEEEEAQAAMVVYPVCVAARAVVSPLVSKANLTTSPWAAFAAKLPAQVRTTSWPRVSRAVVIVTVITFLAASTAVDLTVAAAAAPVAGEICVAVQVGAVPVKITLSAVSFTVPSAATAVFGVNFRTTFAGVTVAHREFGLTLPQMAEAAATVV